MRGASILVVAVLAAALPARAVDFAHEVVPLLTKHCGECHTGDARQGGFSMNTRDDVLAGGDSGTPGLVAGKAAESEIIARIVSDDPDYRMPSEGDPLPAAAVDVLKRWIDEQAPWEPGFAFERTSWEPPLRLREVTLPPAAGGRMNPVDRIVDAYWKERGIQRPPRCDDRTFIRRVSLDLVGLLPEPARVEAFVADTNSDKRGVLVRELLGDRVAYADHWLTFWNDLLRNDYTGTGFITGGRRQITGWLHRSLVENVPFDQFVRELIAPTDESRGFIDGIVWRGVVNASQTVPIQFAQNVGQTFLGINLKCASCHDSFVDRWKLKETYDLAAIYAKEPLELHRCDKATGATATPAWLFADLGQIDPAAPPQQRLEQLAAIMTKPENGWLSRNLVNRLWHRLMGRGLVHPVDSLRTKPWSEDLLEVLAGDLVGSGWNVTRVLETICTSEVYGAVTPAVEGQPRGSDYVFKGPLPRRMTAEQFTDAVWQLTGAAPPKADAEVQRGAPAPDPAQQDAAVQPMVRAGLVKSTPLMAALGRPNRDQVVTSRPADLTTLEAIQLANEQGLFDDFTAGGGRILAANGPDADTIMKRIFAAALSRPPTVGEAEAAREILGQKPTGETVADCLWAVVMLPEFQLIR
ncbi:MAG: DUF1549 domain-containing protein [Planctomycetaceae bacterium]